MAGEELSIKFLTDKMAMSRASLYNKVKLLTGLGVNDYINKLRIEKSVYLLTNTNMNINEISYEVGFSYPRYFSTSFKQVKGMTPTRFKEENKKKLISMTQMYEFILILFVPITSFIFQKKIQNLKFSLIIKHFLNKP